jgi:hypothetical protein
LSGVTPPTKSPPRPPTTYLVGEGQFLMEYDGIRYQGDQGLADVSESTMKGERGYDEWLKIDCSNHIWGWLFMADVKDNPAFTAPNITNYGEAKDAE